MSRFAPLFVVALVACSLPEKDVTEVAEVPEVVAGRVVEAPAEPGAAIASSSSGYSYSFDNKRDVLAVLPYVAPCTGCLDNIVTRVEGLADGQCPVITYDTDYVSVQGDCTTVRGVELVGSMELRRSGDARLTAFAGFEIHDHENNFDFEADGSYRDAGDTSRHEQSFNLTYTWHAGEQADGRFGYDLDVVEVDGVQTVSGEVYVEVGPNTGSFAITSSIAQVADCADEGTGSIELIGANLVTMSMDGAKSCDACGEISFGGEPELICR